MIGMFFHRSLKRIYFYHSLERSIFIVSLKRFFRIIFLSFLRMIDSLSLNPLYIGDWKRSIPYEKTGFNFKSEIEKVYDRSTIVIVLFFVDCTNSCSLSISLVKF